MKAGSGAGMALVALALAILLLSNGLAVSASSGAAAGLLPSSDPSESRVGATEGWADVSGTRHVFLLTPIPEPATIGLLFCGALALLRRKQ